MAETVVVTGATSGVGRAVARAFARDGCRVALLARGQDALDGAARDVDEAGGRALALPTDVADHGEVEAGAAATEEAFGEIDIWVNSAMTTVFSFFDDVEPDEFRRATEVTYLGSVWGFKAALKRMLPRDRGSIVQVGSALGKQGIPLQSAYCGAKHGVQGVFESLRCELRNRGSNVSLSIVQLPGLNTPQFDHCRSKLPRKPMPVPPIYQPEVAAEAVRWAARHRRREVYVGAPTVYTIWGSKLAPWVAEWYLAKTGVQAQQRDVPLGQEMRPGNLFEAVAGDPGAHGAFDEQAHDRSVVLELGKRRRALGLLGAGLAAAALLRDRS
jgi:NAD(P)-dependent dehydrogenase (short-subunit alcohol dehydrogenase family)